MKFRLLCRVPPAHNRSSHHVPAECVRRGGSLCFGSLQLPRNSPVLFVIPGLVTGPCGSTSGLQALFASNASFPGLTSTGTSLYKLGTYSRSALHFKPLFRNPSQNPVRGFDSTWYCTGRTTPANVLRHPLEQLVCEKVEHGSDSDSLLHPFSHRATSMYFPMCRGHVRSSMGSSFSHSVILKGSFRKSRHPAQ